MLYNILENLMERYEHVQQIKVRVTRQKVKSCFRNQRRGVIASWVTDWRASTFLRWLNWNGSQRTWILKSKICGPSIRDRRQWECGYWLDWNKEPSWIKRGLNRHWRRICHSEYNRKFNEITNYVIIINYNQNREQRRNFGIQRFKSGFNPLPYFFCQKVPWSENPGEWKPLKQHWDHDEKCLPPTLVCVVQQKNPKMFNA